MRKPSRKTGGVFAASLALALFAVAPAWGQASGQAKSKPATSAPTHWGWYEPPAAKPAPHAKAAAKKTAKPSTTVSVGGGTSGGRPEVTSTVTKTGGGAEVQQVTVPGANGGVQTLVDQETSTKQLNPNTTRTTKKIYGQDSDGNRKLIAVEQTDTTKLAGGKSRSVMNYSQLDQNGQFDVTRRTVSETVPTGKNSETTNVNVFTPGTNGGLAVSQKIHEVTHKTKDSERTVSTLSRPDGNGGWAPTRKTVTSTSKQSGGAKTEEKNLYLLNADGNMTLARRVVTRNWKAKNGQEHKVTSTYVVPPGATLNGANGNRLNLMQQVSSVKTVNANGTVETRQQTAERSLVSPSNGMQVTGGVVDVASPTKSGVMQTHQTVYTQDGNGQLQQITVFGGEQPQTATKTESATKGKETKQKPAAKSTPAKTKTKQP